MATKINGMAVTLLTAIFFLIAIGCSSDINDDRIPYARVYVPFTTVGDWNVYGVSGALSSRSFIMSQKQPAGYAWPQIGASGYGGVLLTCSVFGEYWAFDLSCPVERDPQVRVAVRSSDHMAECPKCHSVYDVFGINGVGRGVAVSGVAATSKYALRPYNVVFGVDSRYCLLTN